MFITENGGKCRGGKKKSENNSNINFLGLTLGGPSTFKGMPVLPRTFLRCISKLKLPVLILVMSKSSSINPLFFFFSPVNTAPSAGECLPLTDLFWEQIWMNASNDNNVATHLNQMNFFSVRV